MKHSHLLLVSCLIILLAASSCAGVVLPEVSKNGIHYQFMPDDAANQKLIQGIEKDFGIFFLDFIASHEGISYQDEVALLNVTPMTTSGDVIHWTIPVCMNGEIKAIWYADNSIAGGSIASDYAVLLNVLPRDDAYRYYYGDGGTVFAVSADHIYRSIGQTVAEIKKEDVPETIRKLMDGDTRAFEKLTVNESYTNAAKESIETALKKLEK